MLLKIFFKIINITYLIKKDKINCIFFIDSYGGLANFFILYNKYYKNKKILILSNNDELKSHIQSKTNINKKITILSYNFNYFLLNSFIFFLPLLLIKLCKIKVEYFISYKLVSDPFKIFIINIFWSKNSKLIVSDQFIKYYQKHNENNLSFIKKIYIKFINKFLKVKINMYFLTDFFKKLYPCLNIKFNKNIKIDNILNNYKNFYKSNFNLKKKSLLLLDGCIGVYKEANYINYDKTKENITSSLNSFIKKKKIKYVYIKIHPLRKNSFNYDLKLNCKKIYYGKDIPAEIIQERFRFVIITISSSIFHIKNKIIYSLFNKIVFKENFKKNAINLLKQNSSKNFKKLKFL